MKRLMTHGAIALVLGALLLGSQTGCSADARRQRHLTRGEGYFAKGQYESAVIEYMNVLRTDPSNTVAIRQLGLSYFELQDPRRATPFLLKAQESEPENLAIRHNLGALYLWARQFDRARESAEFILQKEPEDFDALIMLADSALTPEEREQTLARLRQSEGVFGDRALFHIALGNLHIRGEQYQEAEQEYAKAEGLAPDLPEVHLAKGLLNRMRNDLESADAAYRKAVELSPTGTMVRVKWADFKQSTGQADEARKILEETLAVSPGFTPALQRLAEMALAEQRIDDAMKRTDQILEADPFHMQGMLLRARILDVQGQIDQSVAEYQKLITLYPNAALFRYHLAVVRLRGRDVREAIRELREAVRTSPGFAEAVYLLAELSIRTGEAELAAEGLRSFIERQPDAVNAYVLLGTAYRAQNKLDQALETYKALAEKSPESPQGLYLIGVTLHQKGDSPRAREAFEQALKIRPDFRYALTQLIMLDIEQKDFDKALGRVQERLAAEPDAAVLYYLMGKIELLRPAYDEAEKALLKAIELNPDMVGAYQTLSQVYSAQGNSEEALARIGQAMERSPGDPSSMILAGMLHQQRNEMDKAREIYEQILAAHPRFTAAANNLAYIYSEHVGDLQKAYDLAVAAHDAAPEDPYLADTLGWIAHKRGEHKWALTLLQEAAAQLPGQPEVVYHLAWGQLALGDEADARENVAKALAGTGEFKYRDQAAELLALLAMDPDNMAEGDVATVQSVLQKDPQNPSALLRLGAAREREGAIDEAAGLYERVLETSPGFAPASVRLARLLSEHKQDHERAFEIAKSARQAAPDDPETAHVLGWIAYQRGEHRWAAGILAEAADKQPASSEIQYHLGLAQYAAGQVRSAEAALQKASAIPESAEFLQFVRIAASPDSARDSLQEAQAVLGKTPDHLPALMIAARGADGAQAAKQYENILAKYRDFTPAMVALADLLADNPATLDRAMDLATKARDLSREVPQAATVLGKILYLKQDYEAAARILRESIRDIPDDSTTLYLLGMATYRSGDEVESVRALRAAIEKDPASRYSQEAQQMLADRE